MTKYRLISHDEFKELWDSIPDEKRHLDSTSPLKLEGYQTFKIPDTDEIACFSVSVPHMLREMIICADRGGAKITLSMEMLRLLL